MNQSAYQAIVDLSEGEQVPFAAPICPEIPLLIFASALGTLDCVGLNAAYLEKSIILSAQDYLSVVEPSYKVDCSLPKKEPFVG